MEFGIFNSLYLPHQALNGRTAARRARAADGRGDVDRRRRQGRLQVHVGDRAPLPHEYSHLSANESSCPTWPRRTENIHLGTGIFNITPPVNHPARVAERVAMLDHLSEGRFEFGMGRGSSTTEQKGFGIDGPRAHQGDGRRDRAPVQAHVARRDYSFDGKFFSMPPRNVLPKPYSDPHPPMWVAAGNPSTFEKAARMGLGVLCFTTGSPETLAPLIEIYKKRSSTPSRSASTSTTTSW